MRPIIEQLPGAITVDPAKLMKSPRHWNPSIQWYDGQLLMAYRYHYSDEDPRSSIAICQINPKTNQPTGKSQYIQLDRKKGDEHHEDPRLFVHQRRLYMSYTEMTHYQPGIDYRCVVKYCRLKCAANGRWSVEQTWLPKYGKNDHTAREKNWAFFSIGAALYAIYADQPNHIVIKIDGENVVNEFATPMAEWPWGDIRGGASPLFTGSEFVHLFHSSVATDGGAPHYMRYCTGYYLMDYVEPFPIKSIIVRPIAKGSEADGHKEDPRFKEGWKPYVVFPCGLVGTPKTWRMSMGVNDWKIVIAPYVHDPKQMIGRQGEGYRPRYFSASNSSMPIKLTTLQGDRVQTDYFHWERNNNGYAGMVGPGYFKAHHERLAETLATTPGVTEITENDYLRVFGLSLRGA